MKGRQHQEGSYSEPGALLKARESEMKGPLPASDGFRFEWDVDTQLGHVTPRAEGCVRDWGQLGVSGGLPGGGHTPPPSALLQKCFKRNEA